MSEKIVVIGSSNIDITAVMKSFPRPGETICGAKLSRANGGKGANQAVAASKLGGDVSFITCLGDDEEGHAMACQFAEYGINTSSVGFVPDVPTGAALIFVNEEAENCIAVAPGANEKLLPAGIDSCESIIASASFLLIQLEVPISAVERAVEIAVQHGVKVILNPAPCTDISNKMLRSLWLITPNQTEAECLTGIAVHSPGDAEKAASALHKSGVDNVIVTMGSKGAFFSTPEYSGFLPSRKVKAVDTTGAGDVFNGALVKALADNLSIREAAEYANACASISVTRFGAQSSIPSKHEVDQIINK